MSNSFFTKPREQKFVGGLVLIFAGLFLLAASDAVFENMARRGFSLDAIQQIVFS